MKFLSTKALITIWSAVLQWSRVGINAIVFLILSRWLTLSEIGAVAAVQAPVVILQTLGSTMFPDFIVQEKKLNNKRLNTVFWLSISIGFCLSISLLFLAPFLAKSINDKNSLYYIYTLAIIPFAWCLASVFEGLHRRSLETKRLAIRTLISSAIACIIAIITGYLGYGGWAIVLFMLISTIISVFLTIYTSNWRPSFIYSHFYIRSVYRKMLALTGRCLLGASTVPILQFTITLQLGTTSGGIFQIASRLCTLVDSIVMTPYRFVLMPMFARTNKALTEISAHTVQAVNLGSLLISPVYIGLAIIAPSLLPFLLGEKNGLACIIALQLLCLNGATTSLSNVINQILTARGYAIVVLKRSILMYATAVLPALFATTYSLEYTLLTYGVFGGLSGIILTLNFAAKYLHIDWKSLISSWLRPFLASFSFVILYFIHYLQYEISDIFKIIIVLALSIPIYLTTLWLFAKKDLKFFMTTIKKS